MARRYIVCLLILCCDGSLAADISAVFGLGSLHTNGTFWRTARQLCKENNGKLFTVDSDEDWERLTYYLNDSDITSFWIGARDHRERWIWANDGSKLEPASIGCIDGDHKLNNTFKSNQPTLCISFCRYFRKKSYAALKGKQCFCYDARTYYRTLSEKECNITCPGNRDKNCGGSKGVTVYSTADSIHWASEDPAGVGEKKDCAAVVRDKDNQTIWNSLDCHQKNRYVCKIETNINFCSFLNLKVPCFYQQKTPASWFEAAKKCKEMGGHLVGRDIEGAVDLDLSNIFYWTSLTRVSQRWTSGQSIDPSLPRSTASPDTTRSCIAMQKYDDGGWVIAPESCKQIKPYLCRQGAGHPSPPYNTILDSDEETMEAKLFNGAHIFFIIIPCMFGVLLTFAMVMVALSLRRCRQKENEKKKQREQHFYFVLEKEESIYNTIDCVDITKNPTGGSTNLRIKNTKPCKVGSSDGTYNKLILKGRRINHSWMNTDHVLCHNTAGVHESQYDQIRGGEHYDTTESVRQNCVILADHPYDQCVNIVTNQSDVTSQQTFHIVGQIIPKVPEENIKIQEENIYETADCDVEQSNSRENLIKSN